MQTKLSAQWKCSVGKFDHLLEFQEGIFFTQTNDEKKSRRAGSIVGATLLFSPQ